MDRKLAKKAILKELLARGYFPIQMPPGFSSQSFADRIAKVEGRWDASKFDKKKSRADRFSVPRSSYFRRNTAVLNPVGFYILAVQIAKFWTKIERHYKKSPFSRSRPSIDPDSIRAIRIKKYSELYEEKVTSAAGFKYALITDVTSFFPTIYTHSIPWALHGKAAAKRDSKPSDKMFGNTLDREARNAQDRQTIGLPIGPDTSHILAEIIGVAIDRDLKRQLGVWPAGFRYVDDFYLFADSREEAERYLAAVTRAVATMELQISPAKTRIIEVRDLIDESWKYGVKKLKISPHRRQQRDDIHHYFEVLFSLEKRYKDESLIKYGLKQISSSIIKKSNWPVFEAYLLKCGFAFPNSIQVICQILATYKRYQYPLNQPAIARFCNSQLCTMAANDCHGEVAWLLWICKELDLFQGGSAPSNAAVSEVLRMGNAVATLILLDLAECDFSGPTVDRRSLSRFAVREQLWESDWLLAYEAGRQGWLGTSDTRYIDADDFFGALKAEGVSFFDSDARCAPIFKLKQDEDDAVDFDTDDAISESFDFDELDEEYFDSVDRDASGLDDED